MANPVLQHFLPSFPNPGMYDIIAAAPARKGWRERGWLDALFSCFLFVSWHLLISQGPLSSREPMRCHPGGKALAKGHSNNTESHSQEPGPGLDPGSVSYHLRQVTWPLCAVVKWGTGPSSTLCLHGIVSTKQDHVVPGAPCFVCRTLSFSKT